MPQRYQILEIVFDRGVLTRNSVGPKMLWPKVVLARGSVGLMRSVPLILVPSSAGPKQCWPEAVLARSGNFRSSAGSKCDGASVVLTARLLFPLTVAINSVGSEHCRPEAVLVLSSVGLEECWP